MQNLIMSKLSLPYVAGIFQSDGTIMVTIRSGGSLSPVLRIASSTNTNTLILVAEFLANNALTYEIETPFQKILKSARLQYVFKGQIKYLN
jgi:hypothetical protein